MVVGQQKKAHNYTENKSLCSTLNSVLIFSTV